MKIWYQSMSRFETKWKSYPRYLRQILDRVKDPGTEIEIHGITKIGGFADQYRYLEYLETGEVMENVHKAMEQKFDAFLIGNIADPGLRECREIANFPVLGLCETSLHVACMMGANFSLVTINEKFTPRIVENVHHYGLRDRLAAVNRMKVDRILNLDEGFENPEVLRDLIGQFQAAAKANTDAGAEVVIAAGGVVMALREDVSLSRLLLVAVPVMIGSIGVIIGRMIPQFRVMQPKIDTINRSKSFEPRSIKSRCPLVMGSNDPG